MSEEQILDFLVKNVDYFVTNDFVIAILRTIGWLLVQGVNYLIEGSKAIYDTTFGLIDITRYSGVQSFISEYRPLLQAVMVLSLVILGYIYIIGKEKRHDLLTSILIFAVVATSSTYLFSTFNTFTVMFKEAVIGGDNNADGKELIRQNLYDLRYIDSQIGLANMNTSGEIPQYHDLSDADLKMINIAEVLTNEEEGLTGEAKDILSKRLIYVQDKSYLEDVYNGVAMTSFGNTYYFRYQFHYGTYFLNAFSLILLYFGLGYVNVKVIVELLRSRVLVVLFSADLSSKKKAVRILESIRDGYYALCFTAIELRLYLILTDYINSKSFLSSLVREVLLVFVAFTMIEGSSIAEKITGVDAGITATTQRLMGAAHAVRGAVQMAMQAKQLSTLSNMNKARSGLGGGREGGMPGNQNDSMSGMPGNGNPDPGTETGSEDKTNRSTSRTESAEHQKDVSGSSNSEMNNRMSGAENADFKENESSTETMDADIRSNVTESSGYSPDAEDGRNGEDINMPPDGNAYDQKDPENGNMAGTTDQNFAKMNEELGRAETAEPERYHGEKDGTSVPEQLYGHENKGMFDRWEEKRQNHLQQPGDRNFGAVGNMQGQGDQTAGRRKPEPTGDRRNSQNTSGESRTHTASRRERAGRFNDKKEKRDE